MTGRLICGVGWFVVVLAAPAAADTPRSLHMRPAPRVAQPVASDAPPAADPPIAAPGVTPDAVVVAPAPVAVTGSRIERASPTTPSGLTILPRDELVASGRTMLGDLLQPLVEQGNALNAQLNNGGDGSTRIDLRGLGADRTLVLLNGRRFVAVGTGADSTVDLNTIPLAVIDRVEILKGAASAVYGSGAIGGVVNLVTRDDFTGTEASLYVGQTQRGDGFTYDASFVTGHHTENRHGNILFAAGIQSQDPVFAGDRAYSRADKDYDFATGEIAIGGSPSTPLGRIDATRIDFNGDGVGDPIDLCGAGVVFCTRGPQGFRPFEQADTYNFQPANYLYTPSSRFNAYTAGSYDLSPGVAAFFESSYMHRESDQQLAPEPFLSRAPISRASIYNPFGGDVLGYSRRLEELGPRDVHESIDTLRTVLGVKGTVPDDVTVLRGWRWELSYSYGRTDSIQHNTGNLILSHLRNALGPSFVDPRSGAATCGTELMPIPGCVPMDILGPSGSISKAAVAYTAFTGVTSGLNTQHTLLATTHGRLLPLPHRGDLSAAITSDVRRESGELTPDPLIGSGDTTGNLEPAVHGTSNVLEVAAELVAVPVRDADGLERAELDLAARVFRYNPIGGVTTSARGLVRPLAGLTLRASYAAGFRTPTITERFQDAGNTTAFASDPCNVSDPGPRSPAIDEACARDGAVGGELGATQHPAILRGNPNVGPERATTFSAGAVVEPAALPGLAVSVDYWQVEVTHAITQPTAQAILDGCYLDGDRSFCALVERDPSRGGVIGLIDLMPMNLGGTSTRGIDVAVVYDLNAGRVGAFHARAAGQRLLQYELRTGAAALNGLGNYDLGVYPKIKTSLTASWRRRGLGAGFNVQLLGRFHECENLDCNGGAPARDVLPYSKIDVFASYAIHSARGQTLVTLGVNNVRDTDPGLIYAGTADSDPSTYDFLGRFFYARVTQLF